MFWLWPFWCVWRGVTLWLFSWDFRHHSWRLRSSLVLVDHVYVFSGEGPSQVPCPFKIGLFVFLSSCKSSLFWMTDSYQRYNVQLIFFHSVGCLFTFWIASLDAHKVLLLRKSKLSIFCCCCLEFSVRCKKSLLNPRSWNIFPCFLWECIILPPLFRPFIYFELILIGGVKLWSNFIFLHVEGQLSGTVRWKDSSFPNLMLPVLSKINWL